MLSSERIASLCHEANRILRLAIGEDIGPHWCWLNQEKSESIIAGVEFRKANPKVTSEEMHVNWMKTANPLHPQFCNYKDLPRAQKAKDKLFLVIVDFFLRQE